MKILFISPHLYSFEFAKGGAEQRTFLILKALSQFAEVDFAAFHSAAGFDVLPINIVYQKSVADVVNRSKLSKWLPVLLFWKREKIFPVNKNKKTIIENLVKNTKYDFIFTRYITKAMECNLLNFSNRTIIDIDDLPSDYYRIMSENSKSSSGKIRYYLMSKIAKFHQKQIIKKVKISFSPNYDSAQFFNCAYLPNIPFYEQSCEKIDFAKTKKRIFFVGGLWYEPNYLGVAYFLKNIYQKLVKKIPDVEFFIAGAMDKNNDFKAEWESFPNVQVLGFVEDIQKEYEKSRAVVVPIYQGAGTNIKVVEAMQMQRACVPSEFATRGFSAFFTDKKDYCVAHSDSEYLEILQNLLTDENFNQTIAQNGHQIVQKYFSFEYFAENLKKAILK
ncbi:MAG: glycosyltransferase family 4 protein [Paludibacter sp.]|nr:glycosyltransferase family 4 protein [Paludibacter sp.]